MHLTKMHLLLIQSKVGLKLKIQTRLQSKLKKTMLISMTGRESVEKVQKNMRLKNLKINKTRRRKMTTMMTKMMMAFKEEK